MFNNDVTNKQQLKLHLMYNIIDFTETFRKIHNVDELEEHILSHLFNWFKNNVHYQVQFYQDGTVKSTNQLTKIAETRNWKIIDRTTL